MELLMELLIIAGIAFWAGWFFRGAVLLARFSDNPEHFIDILEKIKKVNEEIKQETVEKKLGTELSIERHGEMLYAFIKGTDQFVAQGTDIDSVLAEAKKRFPGRKFFGIIPHGESAKEIV
jgi:spore cortex formation protein SpoVR/YcgB (stage V sporulation)